MMDAANVTFVYIFCVVISAVGIGHFAVAMVWAFRRKQTVPLRLFKVLAHLVTIAWYVLLTSLLATPIAVLKLISLSPLQLAFTLLVVCLPSMVLPPLFKRVIPKLLFVPMSI